jgi:signal transduction histidine kinase/putative methionine-R-sulfoxide reductase with GAF domain
MRGASEGQPSERTAVRHGEQIRDTDAGVPQAVPVSPRLSVALSPSPELSTTLNTALDQILEVLGVEGGAVRLLDDETGDLVLVASRGLSAPTRRRQLGEGPPGLVVQRGEPIVVERLSTNPDLARSRLRQEGYESYMVVPLRLHQKLVGTLSLFTKAARAFETYERRFFSQVGLTVENALLYEEAARREREAGFLDRATQLFNSTLQLDTVLQQVVQMATEVLGESCTIHLIEEGKEHLTPVATYHADLEIRKARWRILRDNPTRIGDPASVVGLAAVNGQPYLVKNARVEASVKFADRLGIASFIAAPVIAKDKILGVLATSIMSPLRQFTQRDLRLATALADRAALAIENARLYEQERVLRHTLEGLNHQIQEVNRRKTDFVTLVSHELRTPLTSMTGFIALLLEGQGGPLRKRQREWLEMIGDNAARLVTLIDDLLDMARIEVGKIELKRTPLDLAPLIREVASALRPQLARKGQWLTFDLAHALPAILGDADRIRQILTNLLSNAMKYTAPGGRITITACGDTNHVQIAVRDTGIGLSSEDQEQLFTPFFRAQHDAIQEIGGTGLGLAITRVLVELHGGAITVTSAPGQGSTFSFTLPALQEPAGTAAGTAPDPAS